MLINKKRRRKSRDKHIHQWKSTLLSLENFCDTKPKFDIKRVFITGFNTEIFDDRCKSSTTVH